MRDSKKMAQSERERRLKIVEEGAKSEYWKIIEERVGEMIQKEENFQRSFLRNGMNEKQIEDFNRSVDQVYFMRGKMLLINDILLDEYNSFLDRAKAYVNDLWNKSTSFVGKIDFGAEGKPQE